MSPINLQPLNTAGTRMRQRARGWLSKLVFLRRPYRSLVSELESGNTEVLTQLHGLIAFLGGLWYGTLSVQPVGTYANYGMAALMPLLFYARSQRLLSHKSVVWVIMAVSYTVITLTIAWHGGLRSPALCWYVLLPLPLLFVMGIRVMLAFAALCAATVFAMAALQMHGMLPAYVITDQQAYWASLLYFGLACAVTVLPTVYGTMYGGLLGGLSLKNEQLQDMRDSLIKEQQTKDNFLASVSHELRTPMNAILGFLQVAENRKIEDPEVNEMIGYMSTSAHHLLNVINDLLDISQIKSGKISIVKSQVNVADLLQSTSKMFTIKLAEKGVDFDLQIAANVPVWVWLDKARTTQILINLIGNATKFTKKGFVRVIVTSPSEGHLTVQVQDSGRGITPEFIERVFDQFSDATNHTRQEYGGTGLGLSICRQLAELQGGSIGVSSTHGRGSTFSLSLPAPACAPADAMPERTAQPSNALDAQLKRSVLVVDDQPVNRIVAKQLLLIDFPNIRVVEAADAEHAQAAMATEAFSLVFMDVFMPGVTGIEATQDLRQKGCDVVVVGLTADVSPQVLDRCLAAGMNAVLTKPYNRADLAQHVRASFAAKSA